MIKKIATYFLSLLLGLFMVHSLVWKLPATIADFISDSETQLGDLQALSELTPAKEPFLKEIYKFFSLNWGESLLYQQENIFLIFKHFSKTFTLSLLATFLTFVFVFMLFVLPKRFSSLSRWGISLPGLFVFPTIVYFLCVYGSSCPAGATLSWQTYLWAAFAQAFISAPRIFREAEWEFETVLRKRFILVARAKGLKKIVIYFTHVYSNIKTPLFSLLLLSWIHFVSGSVLLESLFDLPGIGSLMLEAIRSRDLPLLVPLVSFITLLHLSVLFLFRTRFQRGVDQWS